MILHPFPLEGEEIPSIANLLTQPASQQLIAALMEFIGYT